MKNYIQRLLFLATPFLVFGGTMAAQEAQEGGGAGMASAAAAAHDKAAGSGKVATVRVMPERVTMVREVPERVQLLSLNNSLINFQGQDTIWNNIARRMGKDASWTPHTNLGQPLSYHWMETDDHAGNSEGQPSAKTMIRLKPWTHIILQEQTERPRLDYEDFRKSVGRWVDFVRQNCPNPNAVIILPVNWALTSSMGQYAETINLVIDNYRKVAQEYGVVLAPVSSAYRLCYESEGEDALMRWYMDDRHPTIESAYLAACIEYATIYGEDPTTINWAPYKIASLDAIRIRQYAKAAMDDVAQVVDNHRGTVQLQCRLYDAAGRELTDGQSVAWSVDGGGTVDGSGLFTASAMEGDYTATASSGALSASSAIKVAKAVGRVEGLPAVELYGAEASCVQDFDGMGEGYALPTGWRTGFQKGYTGNLGYFALASDEVMFVQKDGEANLGADAECGTWSFGGGSGRAVGGITSGRSGDPRVINVYLHVRNTGATPISEPSLCYDVEKYRKGMNKAGFDVQLYLSPDGVDWQPASEDAFKTHLDADEATEGYGQVPGMTVRVAGTLPTVIQPGGDLFLAWNIRVATGYNAGESMALAIDNVRLNCPPEADGLRTANAALERPEASRRNLAGQRVDDSYKGIVIDGGRKFVRK